MLVRMKKTDKSFFRKLKSQEKGKSFFEIEDTFFKNKKPKSDPQFSEEQAISSNEAQQNERAVLIRRYMSHRRSFVASGNRDRQQEFELLSNGKFANYTLDKLKQDVAWAKRQSLFAQYIDFSTAPSEKDPDEYREFHALEMEKLDKGKFRRLSTSAIEKKVEKLRNRKIREIEKQSKREETEAKKINESEKKASVQKPKKPNIFVRLFSSSTTSKKPTIYSDNSTEHERTKAGLKRYDEMLKKVDNERLNRIVGIYENLYQQPRDSFLNKTFVK